MKATAVEASFVQNIISNSRSKQQVIVLDCCFSGAFAEGLLAKDDSSVSLEVKQQLGQEGRVVLTSSTSTQYSFEQQGSDLSIYTRYLVEGIETGAADLDGDGSISVDELHEYAKRKVQAAAPAMKPKIYVVEEGYRIQIAKAPTFDPKLKYRKKVEQWAVNGEISDIGRITLNELQDSLGLLTEEATIIEDEVLQPYREYKEKLQRYEQAFINAIQNENFFRNPTRQELKVLQEVLGLRNEDVAPIEARIARQKYKKAFSKAIQGENLFSNPTRQDLRRIQEFLELRDEDIKEIEAKIARQKYKQAFSETIGKEYPFFRNHTRKKLQRLQVLLKLRDEDVETIEVEFFRDREENAGPIAQILTWLSRYIAVSSVQEILISAVLFGILGLWGWNSFFRLAGGSGLSFCFLKLKTRSFYRSIELTIAGWLAGFILGWPLGSWLDSIVNIKIYAEDVASLVTLFMLWLLSIFLR